jgi:hypothetical protein
LGFQCGNTGFTIDVAAVRDLYGLTIDHLKANGTAKLFSEGFRHLNKLSEQE